VLSVVVTERERDGRGKKLSPMAFRLPHGPRDAGFPTTLCIVEVGFEIPGPRMGECSAPGPI
jgi:hypothetical protein